MCFTPSLRHLPYVAFETDLVFVRLMMALSCPFKEDRLVPTEFIWDILLVLFHLFLNLTVILSFCRFVPEFNWYILSAM